MHDLAQPGIVFACEELCDALRDWPCIIMMTAGVDALPPDILASVLSKMREFKDFTSDNDPHGEHDFGALESMDIRSFSRSIITTSSLNTVPRIRPTPQKLPGS